MGTPSLRRTTMVQCNCGTSIGPIWLALSTRTYTSRARWYFPTTAPISSLTTPSWELRSLRATAGGEPDATPHRLRLLRADGCPPRAEAPGTPILEAPQ